MIYEEEPVFGELYEIGDHVIYHCEYCATDYDFTDPLEAVIRIDQHEAHCHPSRYKV